MLLRPLSACAAILLLVLVVVAGAHQASSGLAGEKTTRKPPKPNVQSLDSEAATASVPGWVEPTVLQGVEANLDPKSLVVGVHIAGQARAYTLPAPRALERGEDFLIRDTVGGHELSIGFSGHGNQVVVLKWLPDGRRARYPFRVVPWQVWLADHPGSEVVVAGPAVAGIAANAKASAA